MTDSEETKRISYGGLRADEHDVLTDQGWLNISEITMDNRVATLNSDNNHIEYQNPLIIAEYEVDEEMYEVKTKIISQCVTKNHGLFVSRRSSKNGKDIYLQYELMEPTKVHNKKRLKYKTNGINTNPDIDSYSFGKTTVPMDLWLQYLGMWISDGYLSKDGVETNVSRSRKIKFIKNVLDTIGVKYKSYTYEGKDGREPRTFIRVTDHDWRHEFIALNVGSGNKYLPDYTWKLSQRQSEILLNSLIEGDGTKDRNSLKFTTSSKQLANDFQRLCIHSGYSGNIRSGNPVGYTHEFNGKDITVKLNAYIISVIKKCQPAIHDGKDTASTIDRFIHYNGRVVYIKTPNHTLFVRRNGKVSIAGC
jgi:hypothetical protein